MKVKKHTDSTVEIRKAVGAVHGEELHTNPPPPNSWVCNIFIDKTYV